MANWRLSLLSVRANIHIKWEGQNKKNNTRNKMREGKSLAAIEIVFF